MSFTTPNNKSSKTASKPASQTPSQMASQTATDDDIDIPNLSPDAAQVFSRIILSPGYKRAFLNSDSREERAAILEEVVQVAEDLSSDRTGDDGSTGVDDQGAHQSVHERRTQHVQVAHTMKSTSIIKLTEDAEKVIKKYGASTEDKIFAEAPRQRPRVEGTWDMIANAPTESFIAILGSNRIKLNRDHAYLMKQTYNADKIKCDTEKADLKLKAEKNSNEVLATNTEIEVLQQKKREIELEIENAEDHKQKLMLTASRIEEAQEVNKNKSNDAYEKYTMAELLHELLYYLWEGHEYPEKRQNLPYALIKTQEDMVRLRIAIRVDSFETAKSLEVREVTSRCAALDALGYGFSPYFLNKFGEYVSIQTGKNLNTTTDPYAYARRICSYLDIPYPPFIPPSTVSAPKRTVVKASQSRNSAKKSKRDRIEARIQSRLLAAGAGTSKAETAASSMAGSAASSMAGSVARNSDSQPGLKPPPTSSGNARP